jgi:hypothetical protein
MENADYFKLLGQSGIAVVALLVLGRIVHRIGERLIASVDKMIEKLDEHTKADLAAMAEVRADLEAIQVRIDTALDLTPIRTKQQRAKTNPHGVPVQTGYYPPRKPPRDDD